MNPKKLFASIIAFCMLLSLVPVGVSAEETATAVWSDDCGAGAGHQFFKCDDCFATVDNYEYGNCSCEVYSEANCADPKYYAHRCAYCGELMASNVTGALILVGSKTEKATAENKEHTFTESVLRNGDCETPGIVKLTCSECGYYSYVSKIFHKFVETTKDATCTEPAKAGKICSVCGVADENGLVEVGEALGHTFVETTVSADCFTAAGVKKVCSVCGEEEFEAFTGELADPKKEHAEQAVPDVEATCKTPGWTGKVICSVCDTVIAEGHEVAIDETAHNYVAGTVLKAADCKNETNGIAKRVCEYCGAENGYMSIAAQHDYEDVIDSIVPSDCGTDGKKNQQCKVCGDLVTDVPIPATGAHKFVETTKDATCDEPIKVGKICSVCGAEDENGLVEVGEALGHTFVETTVPADCFTAAGVKKVCSVCGEEEFEAFTGELADPKKEHDWVSADVVATCKKTGISGRYACSVCGTVDEARKGTETPANEDSHVGVPGEIIKEATCSESGIRKVVCQDCGKSLTYEAFFLPHDLVAELITDNSEAMYIACSVCNMAELEETFVEDYEHEGHEVVYVPATVADEVCVAGLAAGLKCVTCDKMLIAQVETEAAEHTPSVLEAVDATCTETGLTAGVECAVCGATIEAQTEVPATGHTEKEVPAVDATCTETGLTAGVECAVCGETLVEQEATELAPHTEIEYDEVPATHEECGWTAGVFCTVCETWLSGHEVIPCTENFEVLEAVAPTCTKTGLTEGKKCADCDTIIVPQEVVEMLPHALVDDAAVEATCTTAGKKAGKHCENCDYVEGGEVVEALGHTEEEIPAVEATCTESGLTAGVKCSVCDETLVAQVEEKALGHTLVNDAAVEATCTTAGKEAGKHCANCDYVEGGEVVEATGHTLVDDAAVKATCTTAGKKAGKHCENCDYVEGGEVVEALGHAEEEIAAVAATCTKTGLTAGEKCSVCGEILVAQEEVKALGHTEEEIPAVEATCTETGLTAGKKCTVCGEVTVEQAVVEALGHDWDLDNPTYSYNKDYTEVTATYKCNHDGCEETHSVVL